MARYHEVPKTRMYQYDDRLERELVEFRQQVNVLRTLVGSLSPESTTQLQEYFKLKNIYNSNAIEGNKLSLGETQLVIEQGLTITGKPLKDTVEAKNLSHALDYFYDLVLQLTPITLTDIRTIHKLILTGIDDRNAGIYRRVQVRISGSEFESPDPSRVELMMMEFGNWLNVVSNKEDTDNQVPFIDPIVVACAAHAWFVYIHPFVDGNGRTARLLMNLLLLREGYPLTIITTDDRERYYDALEKSQAGDLTPFINLVLESTYESFEVYQQAAQTQLDLQYTVQALVAGQQNELRNQYDLFASAMQLLRGYFNQIVQLYQTSAAENNISKRVGIRDFGALEFEKYRSLRSNQTAKKTWFFRLALYNTADDEQKVRYLFFFNHSSKQMSDAVGFQIVTIHVARETYTSHYEKLTYLEVETQDLSPDIYEICYLQNEQQYIYLGREGIHRVSPQDIAKTFIEQALINF